MQYSKSVKGVWYGSPLTGSVKFFLFAFIGSILLFTNKFLFLIFLTFLFIYAKNVFVKNRIHRSSVKVLENEPFDDLRPAELGILYDHAQGVNEVVSVYFYLIANDYIELTIVRAKQGTEVGEYILTLTQKDRSNLRSYEKQFISEAFGEKNSVRWEMIKAKSVHPAHVLFGIKQELQRRGYYFFYKEYVDETYEVAQAKSFQRLKNNWKLIFNIGKGVSSHITQKGQDAWIPIAGFRNYLKTAEEDRIQFHANPQKEDAIYIDELMPYAVALGISETWSDELFGWENAEESV